MAADVLVVGPTTSADLNKTASVAIYRTYLENLTTSGRTYDQVAAIDRERYTTEMLTAGGRYYGDTWTDPASL